MESRSPEGLRILVKQKLNQGPYDRFGGRLPRSPVWLRKIPSTVSGSQGSRRGFAPAVRFAFPLGARLNTTLRARPCQELFFRKFFPAVPRAAGRPAFRASALRGGEFGIIRAPGAARAGNPPAHRMPTTPARRSGGAFVRLRQTSHEANTSRAARSRLQRRFPLERKTAASWPARLPRGQSPRRPPLVDSLCQGVSIISILKKLRRDRLFECSSISTASDPTHVCRTAPGLVLKTKKKRAADAALFLNRYIWRQSYASLKNFFLPT